MTAPVPATEAGGLLHLTGTAVVGVRAGRVVVWSSRAEALFGVDEATTLAVDDPTGGRLPALLALPRDAPPTRHELMPYAVVEVVRTVDAGLDVLLLRDATGTARRERGMRRLGALSRQLASGEPSVAGVTRLVLDAAQALTGATGGAVLTLPTEGSGPARSTGTRLVVPLLAGGATVGELAVQGPPGPGPFDGVDAGLLAELAPHAGPRCAAPRTASGPTPRRRPARRSSTRPGTTSAPRSARARATPTCCAPTATG